MIGKSTTGRAEINLCEKQRLGRYDTGKLAEQNSEKKEVMASVTNMELTVIICNNLGYITE